MKASMELVDRCSTLLWTAERERAPIAVLTNEIPALDQATAYAIQWATFDRRGTPLAGFKLGGTVRAAPGVDRRSYGCLAASGRLGESGAPADPSRFMKPGIEAEIALRLGRDLAGAGHTRESVAAHLDAVIPAPIPGTPHSRRAWSTTSPTTVRAADLCWASRWRGQPAPICARWTCFSMKAIHCSVAAAVTR